MQSSRSAFNVQDYKEKRAAQLERARKIREERQPQTTSTSSPAEPSCAPTVSTAARVFGQANRPSRPVNSAGVVRSEASQPTSRSDSSNTSYGYAETSGNYNPPSPSREAAVPLSGWPPKCTTSDAAHIPQREPSPVSYRLSIAEEDFALAITSGIITMEQCNRLWKFLQNKVSSDSTHAAPVLSARATQPDAIKVVRLSPPQQVSRVAPALSFEDCPVGQATSATPLPSSGTAPPSHLHSKKTPKTEWNMDNSMEYTTKEEDVLDVPSSFLEKPLRGGAASKKTAPRPEWNSATESTELNSESSYVPVLNSKYGGKILTLHREKDSYSEMDGTPSQKLLSQANKGKPRVGPTGYSQRTVSGNSAPVSTPVDIDSLDRKSVV